MTCSTGIIDTRPPVMAGLLDILHRIREKTRCTCRTRSPFSVRRSGRQLNPTPCRSRQTKRPGQIPAAGAFIATQRTAQRRDMIKLLRCSPWTIIRGNTFPARRRSGWPALCVSLRIITVIRQITALNPCRPHNHATAGGFYCSDPEP